MDEQPKPCLLWRVLKAALLLLLAAFLAMQAAEGFVRLCALALHPAGELHAADEIMHGWWAWAAAALFVLLVAAHAPGVLTRICLATLLCVLPAPALWCGTQLADAAGQGNEAWVLFFACHGLNALLAWVWCLAMFIRMHFAGAGAAGTTCCGTPTDPLRMLRQAAAFPLLPPVLVAAVAFVVLPLGGFLLLEYVLAQLAFCPGEIGSSKLVSAAWCFLIGGSGWYLCVLALLHQCRHAIRSRAVQRAGKALVALVSTAAFVAACAALWNGTLGESGKLGPAFLGALALHFFLLAALLPLVWRGVNTR